MDFYLIRHLTKFLYANQVSESLMEARMHPRSDNNQRCLSFSLSVSPRCRVFSYRDHLGNNVHHFDIPGEHSQLVMVAEALVEQQPLPQVPQSLRPGAWNELDSLVALGDFSEMMLPSEFAKPSPALLDLAKLWCSCVSSMLRFITGSTMRPAVLTLTRPLTRRSHRERGFVRILPTP
jgi:transglutaminase-like putative cysteine protease